MKIKIGLGQIDCFLGNTGKNLDKHLSFIKEAKKKGVHIIIFPELSLTGYALREMVSEIALKKDSYEIESIREESSEGPDIVFGFAEESDDNRFYNTSLYISKGKIIGSQRKIFLPSYGMFEELRYFSKGDFLDIIETSYGNIGIEICEDTWHPVVTETLVMNGSRILVFQNASPTRISNSGNLTKEKNYLIAKFYSMIYGVYIVMVNRVGFENGINLWGGSAVFKPGGNVVCEGSQFLEELIIAEIDLNDIRDAHLSYPIVRDQKTDILFGRIRE